MTNINSVLFFEYVLPQLYSYSIFYFFYWCLRLPKYITSAYQNKRNIGFYVNCIFAYNLDKKIYMQVSPVVSFEISGATLSGT